MFERHFLNYLLWFLHVQNHVPRHAILGLVRLQRAQVTARILIHGHLGYPLLFHAVDVFQPLVRVSAPKHVVECETLPRHLLLDQSRSLRRGANSLIHV